MRNPSKLSRFLFPASITLVLAWFLFLDWASRDYGRVFLEVKGRLASVTSEPAGGDQSRVKTWVTLTGTSGLVVRCGVLRPWVRGRQYPAVILLGGKATGKDAIDYVPDIGTVLVVAVDYPYEPRASYTLTEFLGDVPAMRQALLTMVPSVMLVTDYLATRGDVDTARIVLLGYSFGAPFVPCILAHDKRSAVAAMVYGGGELGSLIEHNVRRYESPVMSAFVGQLGAVLLRPLEPLRYADKISPVPLVMINGTDDELIPRHNVEKVFRKAGQPKKIIWLSSGHVRPDKRELTETIVATLKRELRLLGVF